MSILIVSILLGVAKGFRILYMNILIPNCVPFEKLAAATNIQALVNGFISLSASPILGKYS
jgi:hypothetical protein